MAKYTVSVVRTAYACMDIEVEAENEKEAREKALEEAGNHVFNEHDADYLTDGVWLSE
jgi:hypothetical protein